MRYDSNYEGMNAYIRTCSLHKHYKCLNCVWCTVMFSATICVRYLCCVCKCALCHVRVSLALSLPLILSILFHFLTSIIFKVSFPHPHAPQQDKRFAVSLFPSLFVSLCHLISLCHHHLLPLSPLHLVRIVSPFLFNLIPSLHHSVCASICSIAPRHQAF